MFTRGASRHAVRRQRVYAALVAVRPLLLCFARAVSAVDAKEYRPANIPVEGASLLDPLRIVPKASIGKPSTSTNYQGREPGRGSGRGGGGG